jgi:hypothetical protein
MQSLTAFVNKRGPAPASQGQRVSCSFNGETFTAQQSSFKAGRFIFGYQTPTGAHIRVRCSGPVELRRCLSALHSYGLLPLPHGGAA